MIWWPWLLAAFGWGVVAGALAMLGGLYAAANLDNPESWWGRR